MVYTFEVEDLTAEKFQNQFACIKHCMCTTPPIGNQSGTEIKKSVAGLSLAVLLSVN
jgi:hypothetical protein